MTRIGAYDVLKHRFSPDGRPGLLTAIPIACGAAACGSIIGNPWDIVQVRMQADGGLPAGSQR